MILTEDNFLGFAMRHYDNPQCLTIAEFEEDLKRFTYLKKLLFRYRNDGILLERRVLNHLIILFNVFGHGALPMLFFRMEKNLWPAIITFLIYLERMPEQVPEFGIQTSLVKLDQEIINRLRQL